MKEGNRCFSFWLENRPLFSALHISSNVFVLISLMLCYAKKGTYVLAIFYLIMGAVIRFANDCKISK